MERRSLSEPDKKWSKKVQGQLPHVALREPVQLVRVWVPAGAPARLDAVEPRLLRRVPPLPVLEQREQLAVARLFERGEPDHELPPLRVRRRREPAHEEVPPRERHRREPPVLVHQRQPPLRVPIVEQQEELRVRELRSPPRRVPRVLQQPPPLRVPDRRDRLFLLQ